METGTAVGLLIGLGGALVAFVVAGLAIAFAVRQIRRGRADAPPRTVPGPRGEVVEVPVRQISRIVPGAPAEASGRATGFVIFRIHPDQLEYRILRRVSVPFAQVAEVDTPYRGRPYLTVRFHHRGTGIGVVAGSEYAVRYALWRLSAVCPLTERAQARISA